MRLAMTLLALTPLALAGCGPGANDPGPGGVTVGEARALDDAAEMLDHQRGPMDEAAASATTTPAAPTPATTPAG